MISVAKVIPMDEFSEYATLMAWSSLIAILVAMLMAWSYLHNYRVLPDDAPGVYDHRVLPTSDPQQPSPDWLIIHRPARRPAGAAPDSDDDLRSVSHRADAGSQADHLETIHEFDILGAPGSPGGPGAPGSPFSMSPHSPWTISSSADYDDNDDGEYYDDGSDISGGGGGGAVCG